MCMPKENIMKPSKCERNSNGETLSPYKCFQQTETKQNIQFSVYIAIKVELLACVAIFYFILFMAL